MYLDLGRWITGSALCLSGPLKRLAYSFSGSLLQRQSTSQGNMGDTEPPEILYETFACIIHYNLQLHVHYNCNTPRSSEEPQRLQTTSSGYPKTKGQES